MPGGGGTSPFDAGVRGHRGRLSGALGAAALTTGRQLGVGVDDVVRAGRLGQVRVDRNRDVVQVEQPQRRARGTRCTTSRSRARWCSAWRRSCRTRTAWGWPSWGSRSRRGARRCPGRRCCSALANAVGRDVQDLLEVILDVDQRLGDLASAPRSCSAVWLRRSRDESLHLVDGRRRDSSAPRRGRTCFRRARWTASPADR